MSNPSDELKLLSQLVDQCKSGTFPDYPPGRISPHAHNVAAYIRWAFLELAKASGPAIPHHGAGGLIR